MTVAQWLGLVMAVITIGTAFAGVTRFLVKHYLSELKPNGGSSMKDSITRLERQVEQIMIILMTENTKPKRKAAPKE